MTVHLSLPQARQFLASYHFQPTTLPAIFEQLGTVQYDPLNPVGRNPDLVFQARIPGYQVDDWQTAAYQDRLIYDAWDKQACLVPVSDWPLRAIIRAHHRPYHDREILGLHPDLPRTIMAAIDSRGPLSSLEFEERARYGERNSWYGITQINRALRAMWVCGELLTHHRKNGRHYYDRPERVIPAKHFAQPLLADHDAYLRWIVARRIQAVGLLRLAADPAIWSVCGKAEGRKRVIAELLEEGTITQVTIETLKTPYYIPTSALPLLDTTSIPADRMRILGPLDNLLWDRKNLQQLFNFSYIWEVYKPASQRRWGYYVLPVFYKNRFIARLDSRLEKGIWTISQWWWEDDVTPDADMLTDLTQMARAFLHYLRADGIQIPDHLDHATKVALLAAG